MKLSSVYTAVILACCLLATWLFIQFFPILNHQSGAIYELQPTTTKSSLTEELTNQGVIKFPLLFTLYAHLHVNTPLRSGEYLFKNNATMASIWKQVSTGTGFYNHTFTIVPGWTFNQLAQQLLNAPHLQHHHDKIDGKEIMTYLGQPNLSPEGQFYPDTYYYYKNNTDISILKRAYQLMQKKLTAAWEQRSADLPYKNSYEALIAASLIEKEAYLNTDRPKIASVIVNRLRRNMILQIDPTVIYGLGDRYTGKIRKQDLKEDTPYNTYLHTGLPPTPIAMPGKFSILAAMHPEQSDYYYFVAKADGEGGHEFSSNLKAHQSAVQLAMQRRNSGGAINEQLIKRYIIKILNGNQ